MKKLSLLLTTTLLLSACSKTVKEVHSKHEIETQAAQVKDQDLEILRKLVNAKSPNLALAELLAKSVSFENQDDLKMIIAELNPSEIEMIVKDVEEQNKNLKNVFLFHHQNYQDNKEFLSQVINNEISVNIPSVSEQLSISVFGYVKNKALDEIVGIYNKRAAELSKEIALQIALEIATKHPFLARQIESVKGDDVEVKIRDLMLKSKPIVEKIDALFKSSTLTHSEQYTLLITGLVAGGVYAQLSEHHGFQNIIKQSEKIIEDAKKLNKKVNEICALVETLSTHIQQTSKNARDFNEGLAGTTKDLRDAFEIAKQSKDQVDSKKMMNFIYDSVVGGKKGVKPTSENTSVLSTKLSKNAEKTANAVIGMADNLSTILTTTNNMMLAFGIKPSKDVQKIMEKAQKVAQLVSVAKSAMVGYATGGPVGAVTALAGNPAMASLLGGGGGDSAKLAEISKKLTIIIQNQEKMMKLQLETMKMIKELALMIDTYHQQEMMALSEIRNFELINLELLKTDVNKPLTKCESIINKQINLGSEGSPNSDSIKNISNFVFNRNKFNSNIINFTSFQQMVKGDAEDTYKECQNGLSQAFDGNSMVENPTRAIYSADGNKDLMNFEKEKYLPLLQAVYTFADTENLNSIPLHLPVSDINSLKTKTHFLDHAKTNSTGPDIYDLPELISTNALERYVSSLLILYPIMEFDKNIWMKSMEEVIETYLVTDGYESRSESKLKYALKLTQSAIAQEAILAGEPILHRMHDNVKLILSNKDCVNSDDCAIRANKMFMKNFMMYALHFQNDNSNDFFKRYALAYSSKDLATLARLFNTDLINSDFEINENEIFVKLKGIEKQIHIVAKIKLPSPEALKEGKILYSENMPRLILMQKLIIEELNKVTPVARPFADQDMFNLILLANRKI